MFHALPDSETYTSEYTCLLLHVVEREKNSDWLMFETFTHSISVLLMYRADEVDGPQEMEKN